MLTKDLFSTKFERELHEGAIDNLEARYIDDLNRKMDDLLARARQATDPAHKAALKREYDRVKSTRSGYFGSDKQAVSGVDESGIGQDIANKSEKMARATPPTPAGKVASTVKNAAKWLAGKGGPGQEGPTYESDNSDEDNYEQVLDAIAALYGPEIWDNDAMGDLANDLEQVNPTPQELDFIIKHGKLPKRLQGMQFTNNDTVQFGEGADDIADRGEYDREGDMAKDNIHTIVRNARELESVISDDDNLPEWVQDKLANIKGMMTAVSEYMQTQHEREGVVPEGTETQWSKESDWKAIPKSKSGRPVDPRGEVTHLSDVARRQAERKAQAQKKSSKEVAEHGGGIGPKQHWQDLMPEGFQDFNKVEPYAVCLAGKPVKKFDYYEEARRFHDNWKQKLYREGDKEKADKITLMPLNLDEASNYGSRPQDMLNYDNNELRALRKFVVKKLLPSGVRGSKKTAIRAEYLINSLRTNMGLLDPKFNSREMYKSHTEATERDVRRVRKELYQLLAPYGFQAVEQGVAEAQTDYQKRRQRERDVDAGKPVVRQRPSKQTDYQKRRAQDRKDMELGEGATVSDKDITDLIHDIAVDLIFNKQKMSIRDTNPTLIAKEVKQAYKMEGMPFTQNDLDRVLSIFPKVMSRLRKGFAPEVKDIDEEKTRLDPKCWTGKKIGTPKTKMKGGVRVNNCVPATEDIYMEDEPSPVESAIIRRIMVSHVDWLQKFGPEKVMQAAEEVAYNVGDVDEIGTSDVSAYVHEVGRILGAV